MMTDPHTIHHAIEYLQAARDHSVATEPESERVALGMQDPQQPCAAYDLAKRTYRQTHSLADAIRTLRKELQEESEP